MTAIGDLSIVKVTLTRVKGCREGVSKTRTTAKTGLLLKLKHCHCLLLQLQTHQTVKLWLSGYCKGSVRTVHAHMGDARLSA